MSWFDELAAASGVDKQSDYGQSAVERDAAEAAARANYDTAWNYLTHMDGEGFADYTNRKYNYRDIPFLGQIVGHTADSATQGVADIAQFLNFDDAANYLNDKAQAGEARLTPMAKPELSWDYITDPNGLASAGASVIGSMLAMAPIAMLVPGGALATAARIGAAIPKVGSFMKGFLPEALRWGATGPVEAMMEGGNTERQLLEKGVSRKDADAAARKVFFDNALLLSGTNALEGGLLRGVKVPKGDNVLGRLGGAAERAAERSVFARGALNTARFAPAAAAEVGLNGFEEGAQQGIQDAALGQGADSWQQFLNPAQWTDEQWDATKMGVAGTLPLMAGIGGIRYAHNRAGIKRIGAEDFGNDPLKNGETALQTDAVNQNILNQQAAADQEFALPSQTSDSSTRKQDKAVKKSKNTMPSYEEQSYEISDEVSNTAATDDTKARLNALAHDYKQQFGEKLMVTSMKRSGNGESWHDEGKAFDVAGGGLETNKNGEREWLMKRGQELGLTPLDEYASPSDHATGGHIHFSNHDDENKPAIVGEEESSKKSSGALTKSSGNQQYDAWIEKSAAAHGVPANLLSSLLEVESGYNPEAKSSAGAIGIAQFMPETAKEYGIDPTNPEQAIEGAAQFLQQKYEKYGNWHQALEAYNGGDGNVGISETKAYADKVLNGAGKLDTQVLDKKTAAIPDSEEIPDFIQQGTEDSAEFYDQFAQDVLASATDISQIDALGSMMKRNGKFNNTEKNRKLLAEMFPSEMMDYYNRIFKPRNKDFIMRDIAENLKQQAIAEKKLDLYESLEDALRTNDKPAIETLVKRYGKSQTGKRAAETSGEKVATPNLTKAQEQGRKLISLMRENNIPFNEKTVERAVSHGDPKVNRYMTGELSRAGVDAQNIVGYPTTMMARPNVSHPIKKNIAPAQQTPQPLMLAMAPIANTVPQRQQQARAIRQIAADNNIKLPKPMLKPLAEGARPAIIAAQERLQNAGIRIERAEQIVKGMTNHENQNTTSTASAPAEGVNTENQIQHTESKQAAEQKEKVSHFDTSDFTHTKTGKKITAAKISNKVDRDTYVRIRDIAKKHGGRYNPFARRFFFRDSAGRDAFTQETERKVFKQEQAEAAKVPAREETIAPKEKESQTETSTNKVKAVFSDKSGSMKGGIANGVMTVWQKPGGLPKKEFSFSVTLDEVEKALKTGGANSRYTIHQLAKGKLIAATEAWIEGSKTKVLRDTRRDHWENDIMHGKWSTLQAREIDSAARVIENLYEQATGHKPQSFFEKRAEEKANTTEKSQTETNTKAESTGKKIVSKSGKTATVITDSDKGKIGVETAEQPESNKKAAKEGEIIANDKQTETDKVANEGGSVEVTGNEFGKYEDIKELRKKALAYYAEHWQGTYVKNIELGEIDIDRIDTAEFTGSGKREIKSTSAKEEKLLLIKYLPKLIHQATDITENTAQKERHANEHFYYLHTSAMMNGKETPVDITLIKRNDGRVQFYNLTLQSLEDSKKNEPLVSSAPVSPKGVLGTPTVNGSSVSSVAQVQENSKKIIDKDNNPTAADDSIFGSQEEADAELLAELGIDPNETDTILTVPEGIENTAAERERLEKELMAELNKISANPVFNPKIYTLGLKLGMTYVKDGINTAKRLVAKLELMFGDKIEPWAPAIVETINTWQKGVPFNEQQVMKFSKAVGARYEKGMTSLDDIQKDMGKLLKDQHKTFAPVIEASYNGVKKFFDTKGGISHAEQRSESTGKSTADGHSDLESGTVRGADAERGAGSTGRDGGAGERKQAALSRNETDNSGADGESGKSGGRSTKRMGSADDRTGNGAGRTESPVLNGDKPDEIPGSNYHIKHTTNQGVGGEKTKYKQNVDAIRLLKKLMAEDRNATPSEQDILASFNGWGPVKAAFSDDPEWAKENKELHEILTKEEYNAAARATNNAFYTSPELISAMWKGMKHLGFTGGRILDPSMGVGNFFGMMPAEMMEKSHLYGVELDKLTAGIAKQLYQKADIKQGGFETTRLPDNFFDLAISNVPFGSYKLTDPAYEKSSTGEKTGYLIHNYFFAKAMDKVRPGGLVAFITGPGTMQSSAGEANTLRLEMGRKADLVAAFKLPGEAFAKHAGTSITTDVLILQKRVEPKKPAPYAQKWQKVSEHVFGTGWSAQHTPLNEYYKAHPENMLGTPQLDTRYGGSERFSLEAKGKTAADISKSLTKAMGKLPKEIFAPVKGKEHSTVKATQTFWAEANSYDHAYSVKDGKAYQNVNGVNTAVPAKDQKIVRNFVKLRSALNSVLKAQIDPLATDKTLDILRKDLNTVYDSFVKEHGYLNKPGNVSRLGDDPMYGQTASIEKYKESGGKTTASKTDIFTKRTVGAIREVTTAATPSDALAVSIAQHGRVDLPYMASLLGKTETDVIKSLEGTLYHNPVTDGYELAEEYLSGNVRAKLEQAKAAAKTDPTFKTNVEALEKVQPIDMTEHDVTPHLGAPWIPQEIITDFTEHMVGTPLEVYHDPITGTWSVSKNNIYRADRTAMNNKWGFNQDYDFRDLLEAMLGMKDVTIRKYDATGENRIVDPDKTAAAAQKMEDIQKEFETWIWSDEGRKTSLLKTYNKLFNSEVERQYDGSALTFPGLVQHVKDKLYAHQKNVIWRIMQGGNTLIAHCVGAGKTWSMQIAGMEMKRVGLCRKPMYVVPNNVVEQFRREFYETYPNAKLLVLTSKELPQAKTNIEFEEKLDTAKRVKSKKGKAIKSGKETETQKRDRLTRRRAALSRIATEDWDGIIISHNLFANLPMSPEYYQNFYREMVDELDTAIREMKGSMSKRDVTALENAKANLEEKLKRDISEDKKEIVIPFEELGVDQLFVDEADKFKNLAFHTSMTRLSGISSSGSKRAMDMYVKTRYLGETQKGRGVCFATGTPISNTMNEMFTMQRYLQPEKLKDLGMKYFDSWAAMFGSKKSEAEPEPNGNGFRMIDKLKFTNLRSLGAMFRSFADIKMPEDLPYLERPKLKGGKRTVVAVKSSKAFDEFKKTLIDRVEKIRKKLVSPTEDNMLKVTSDFRNASMDMRLVDPSIPGSEAGAKINALADVVFDRYQNGADSKGAQLIFSDIGTPKTHKEKELDSETIDGEVNAESVTIYGEIKKALIKRGIPAEEIGFVHDAKNTKQRQKLFDKVRAGELRVFIGSTEMMGAGTNFQDHLIALHHFDCPWKPRDIEQREGRILRAGNKNPEVEIFSYVTEGSFDANMWDKVRYKQQMIDSVMHGDPSIDEMDDINSNASASFGDIEALAMDNQLMADKVKADAKVARLQSLASTYNKERRSMQHELNLLPGKISALTDDIERIQKDVENLIPTRGEAFSITIGKNTFTKRADAKTAWEVMNKAYTATTSKKVGKIGGMDIHLMRDNSYAMVTADGVRHATSNTVQLVGHRAYSVGNSIESMEKAVNGGIKANLQIREEELKELEKREKGLTAQLKEPFSKHKELNEALAEQKRINDELDKLGNGVNKKYSVSADNRLDNSDNSTYSKNIGEHRKNAIHKNVTARLLKRVQELQQQGMTADEIRVELNDENSRSREIATQVFATQMNVFNSPRVNKRNVVERITKNTGLSDSEVNSLFDEYKAIMKEMNDYAGFIYKETALHTGRNGAVIDGFPSWRDAERANAGHGGTVENQINGSRSEKDGFSNAKNSAEEGRLQTARAMDDFVEDIKDAIPNAKGIDVDGTRVTVTMANGSKAHFDVVDRIGLTAEEETRVRKENNLAPDMPIIINGSERVIRGEGFIQLARNGRLGTAAHEITHIAMDLYLTDKEKAAVNRGYAKTVKVTGREVDELFADDVRDMKLSRKRYQNYAKLIRKVLNGIEDLKYIYKHSFDAYKTMRKVRSGEVFERQPGQQSSGRSFAGENKQLDNSDSLKDNVANKVFDRYLNDGIMKMVKDTVAKEIGEHVNLADMKDPVARDEARDSLPYIRQMLVQFNVLKAQKAKQEYIDRYATKIEYARRCFDNDYRIRREAVRAVGRNSRQEQMGRNRNEDNAKPYVEGSTDSSGRSTFGVSQSVSGGKFGARDHFLKLYEEESRSEKDGFSDANFSVSPAQETASKNFLRKQFEKLGKSAGIKAGKIIVEEDGKTNSGNEINLKQYVFASPSRIAKKVAAFREFYNMGSRAMDVLTKNRSDYGRKLGEAFELVKNKEDRQTLNDILLSGDAEGVEFTKQELINDGINENVAEAYIRIRRLMTKAYRLVNEARRRPQIKTINKASDKQIQELQRNKFIDILRVSEDENGHKKVTYKEYANWEKTYTVDKETMDRFYTDPAMQILDVYKDGDEYTATVRESVPPVNKLTGYIPHFFHQYMIRVKDEEGKVVATVGSGRTEREAIQRAEACLKDNELGDGQTIYIAPKTFDFTSVGMDEGQYAAVMGDKDYYKMMDNVAKNNDLTLAEAKELMKGSVRQKNRHRFFGNVMQRKGVAGFETDMGYILNHYFSSASRYYAMETEFKPQAINLYERLFGDFNQDAPTVTADYIKDYINDINGNPATLEKAINNALMKSKYFRKYVSATFGERAALRLTNSITGATTYMCLGYLNVSSALLNLTQVINSAAYIGDVSALAKCISKGAHKKYSLHDMKILMETNVLNDIGLDSGSGYDMNRMNPKKLLGKINKTGMILFKESEGMVRRGTVLAAYEKAIKDGRTHDEAIKFAKEVNQKANFNYGVEDAPNIFRRGSILSQLALQFKKYGIKELEVMVDMLPTNSKTSRKQKMIFWGMYFLAAGLMGLPMLDFFDEWPFNGKLKLNIEACMMEAAGDSPAGKALVKTALFGGLASTVGIDISNRAGLSDVIPTRPGDLAGAAISKTGSFISDMMKGDHASALRDVSPGLYNQYAAWIAERSIGKRGRVNNTYDSFHDKVLRSMGFKSTNERIDSDISRIVTMRKTELTQEKQKAIDDYIDTPSTENYKRLKELGIKPGQVKNEREKKKQDRMDRTADGMSKDAKKRNDRLMKFAE